METGILKTGLRARRVRAGKLALLGATLVAGAFISAPASANLPLDLELPPLPPLPLPLPTLSTGIEVPLAGTVDTVTKTVTGVTGTLSGITSGGGSGTTTGTSTVIGSKPKIDSWSLEQMPGLQGSGAASETTRTTVSSTRLGRAGAYTSLVGNGIRATARRVAALAGPLAAPIVLAMFALVMLAVAARGPGKLVKVDEDRQAFRDRRNHRL